MMYIYSVINDAFDNKPNRKILVCTVQFIKDPRRFDKSFLLCYILLIQIRRYFSKFVLD